MKNYDVAIIGLGPTGGTLANLIALGGFSVIILDREKSFYPLPRAVHFDDEVMRVFQTIGIAKSFLNYTIINKGTKFVNSKGKVILDWPRPRKVTENGWYPSYRFNQPDLEKQLRKKLREYKRVEIKNKMGAFGRSAAAGLLAHLEHRREDRLLLLGCHRREQNNRGAGLS